jgi:hypothetical protein
VCLLSLIVIFYYLWRILSFILATSWFQRFAMANSFLNKDYIWFSLFF